MSRPPACCLSDPMKLLFSGNSHESLEETSIPSVNVTLTLSIFGALENRACAQGLPDHDPQPPQTLYQGQCDWFRSIGIDWYQPYEIHFVRRGEVIISALTEDVTVAFYSDGLPVAIHHVPAETTVVYPIGGAGSFNVDIYETAGMGRTMVNVVTR